MGSYFVSNNFFFFLLMYIYIHISQVNIHIYYLWSSGTLIFLILFEGFLVVWSLCEFLQPRSGSLRVCPAAETCFLLGVSPGDTNFCLLTVGKVKMTNLVWMPNCIWHYGMCRMTYILCRNLRLISNLIPKRFCSLLSYNILKPYQVSPT